MLIEKERENSVASGRFVKLHNRPTPLVDKHYLLQPAERKQMQPRCLAPQALQWAVLFLSSSAGPRPLHSSALQVIPQMRIKSMSPKMVVFCF